MKSKELQSRLEALEQYVVNMDRTLSFLEAKYGEVSVIFDSSLPEEKTLQEQEKEMDEFIEEMNKASMASLDDGPPPF